MKGGSNRSGRSVGRRAKQGKRSSVARDSGSGNGVNYSKATRSGCSTGKWAWQLDDRAGAKTLVKTLRKGGRNESKDGGHVREYVCPECDRWHVGHLPGRVMSGEASADDVFDERRKRDLRRQQGGGGTIPPPPPERR